MAFFSSSFYSYLFEVSVGIVHGVVFIEDLDDLVAVKVLNLCCVLVSLRPNSGLR